jgi:hypothetical protein
MGKRRHDFDFPHESRQGLRIVREALGQRFHGDVAAQPRVPRAVDLAHPSGAERRQNLVRTKAGSGNRPHSVSRLYRARASDLDKEWVTPCP